jgi:hypothetical protein
MLLQMAQAWADFADRAEKNSKLLNRHVSRRVGRLAVWVLRHEFAPERPGRSIACRILVAWSYCQPLLTP